MGVEQLGDHTYSLGGAGPAVQSELALCTGCVRPAHFGWQQVHRVEGHVPVCN
jgi:hypothetical protein